MFDLSKIQGFVWDSGNQEKNWLKHNVATQECEEVFFNQPIVLFDDEIHSNNERRYGLLGETDDSRQITVFFTMRQNHVRVISARDQSRKERAIYVAEKERFFSSKAA